MIKNIENFPECPYDLKRCSEINTATMTLYEQCSKCKRYNHGIRLTEATPILAWILKKLKFLNES